MLAMLEIASVLVSLWIVNKLLICECPGLGGVSAVACGVAECLAGPCSLERRRPANLCGGLTKWRWRSRRASHSAARQPSRCSLSVLPGSSPEQQERLGQQSSSCVNRGCAEPRHLHGESPCVVPQLETVHIVEGLGPGGDVGEGPLHASFEDQVLFASRVLLPSRICSLTRLDRCV